MTIEEALGFKDAAPIAAMSDEDLVKHFEPLFNITRPERQTNVRKSPQVMVQMDAKLAKGLELCKGLGIDVAAIMSPVRKKGR